MNIGFCMLFRGLDPMEETHPLLVLHRNYGITTTVYHLDNISVCLNTVRYEFFELGLRDTMPCRNIIEVLPKYHLSSIIL